MPTWTQTLDDTFTRADTSPGSAGSTTGVGNGWTDKLGLIYRIQSNQLVGDGSALSLAPRTGILYRAADNYRDQKIVGTIVPNADGSAQWSCVLRADVTNGNWYTFEIANNVVPGTVVVGSVSGGNTESPVYTFIDQQFAGSFTVGHPIAITVSVVGASPTALVFTLIDLTTDITLSSGTYSNSAAGLQQAGSWGLLSQGTASAYSEVVLSQADGSSPVVGTASFVSSPNGTVINVLGTAPSGVSSPTYQWYASKTAGSFTGSTPSTFAVANMTGVVTGPTTLAWAHTTGSPPDTAWYYFLQTTVSGPALFSAAPIAALQGWPVETIGWLGDSIMAYCQGPTDNYGTKHFISVLNQWKPNRNYTVINSGDPGTATADWLIGGTLLGPAITSWKAASVQHVLFMLGANDSHAGVSAATYAANVLAICNTLVANGLTPILQAPPSCIPGGLGGIYLEPDPGLLHDYGVALSGVANGTTILLGDTALWAYSAQNAASFWSPPWDDGGDGVHPSQGGQLTMVEYMARGYLSAVGLLSLLPSGGSSATFSPIGCGFIKGI